jgi:hypothetical protein
MRPSIVREHVDKIVRIKKFMGRVWKRTPLPCDRRGKEGGTFATDK